MRSFAEILDIAARRHGGPEAALAGIPVPLSGAELGATRDDGWLSAMARSIFQAGISWQVVETKWPEIEAAFGGFDPGRLSMMSDEAFDDLLRDPRVIRSAPKIAAIRDNAAFIREVSAASGSFGRRIADWPAGDFIGLLDWLKTEGARLGGGTGAHVLRRMGRDGFVLGRDVVARLIEEGVIDKPPASRRAMLPVQAAFDRWAAESGLPFTTISRVLARSIG
ncbi:DNA-3-methyladenine glycosylase I [Salipiger sp.]|uniref:DNA-3-methyladenine glycosylase I n=1 Tax=Salipiger sp. TaxID=2078585 RepID=UPI003A9798EA